MDPLIDIRRLRVKRRWRSVIPEPHLGARAAALPVHCMLSDASRSLGGKEADEGPTQAL